MGDAAQLITQFKDNANRGEAISRQDVDAQMGIIDQGRQLIRGAGMSVVTSVMPSLQTFGDAQKAIADENSPLDRSSRSSPGWL